MIWSANPPARGSAFVSVSDHPLTARFLATEDYCGDGPSCEARGDLAMGLDTATVEIVRCQGAEACAASSRVVIPGIPLVLAPRAPP